MKEFKSPVYNVIAVPIDKVQANDYNPNSVAPPEMELLETSIWETISILLWMVSIDIRF
jgi:hypothetical protein